MFYCVKPKMEVPYDEDPVYLPESPRDDGNFHVCVRACV